MGCIELLVLPFRGSHDDRTPLDVAANYKRVDALALLSQPAKKKVLGFDDEEKKVSTACVLLL